MSTILYTASTKVLLNGRPGNRICHGRGFRKGEPLSPMPFVLVMECFNTMFIAVEEHNIFVPLGAPTIWHRILLYADDVVVFVSPVE
jgi:hypothetical protein